MVSRLRTTFFHPSLMPLNAVSFLGVMNPEWTRRTRVPVPALERVYVTTVLRGAP